LLVAVELLVGGWWLLVGGVPTKARFCSCSVRVDFVCVVPRLPMYVEDFYLGYTNLKFGYKKGYSNLIG
jgi:hypothetical protein